MRTATLFATVALATLVAAGASVSAAASEAGAPGSSSEALRIARTTQPGWTLGRLVLRDHDGRHRLDAELLSGGTPVARLRVDPGTGRLLPRGERGGSGPALDPARLRSLVTDALGRLELGTWAWPTEHGRAWAVPLRSEGRVVGAIKVDVRRERVLPVEHDDDDDDD